MTEETGITFIGALGIAAIVVGIVLVIWHLHKQQNPGSQPAQSQEPFQIE